LITAAAAAAAAAAVVVVMATEAVYMVPLVLSTTGIGLIKLHRSLKVLCRGLNLD
jgi:hypothetical protein